MRLEAKIAEITGIDGDAVRLEAAETGFPTLSPSSSDISLVAKPGSDTEVIATYITPDDSQEDYWSSAEGLGSFKTFTNQTDRDAHIDDVKAEGKIALIVDKYEHGNVHYSVEQTAGYPDRRWDVAPSGVFTPCDDVQDKYQEAIAAADKLDSKAATTAAKEAALASLIKDSNNILNEFSDWSNGSVYGVVQETWEIS
ncbi:MAG: hypothetical protein ABJN51_14085, partial [Sneathiella sp.]